MKTQSAPPVVCHACGRPGRELQSCPWCGERVPLARQTRTFILLFVLATALSALAGPFRGEGLLAGILFALSSGTLPEERHAAAGAWLCLPLFLAFSALNPFPLPAITQLGAALAVLPPLALLLRGGIPPILPQKSRLQTAIEQWAPPAIACALFAACAFLLPNPLLPLSVLCGFWCRRRSPGAAALFLFALGCGNPCEIPFLLAGLFAGICGNRLVGKNKRALEG